MQQKENKYFIFDIVKEINFKYVIKKILSFVIAKMYKVLLLLNNEKNKTKKFKVSICAIFKNEAPYMKEWIEFHRVVGIEHFYLYNNFSNDNYRDVLDDYIKEGLVTLIDWPVPQGQNAAYIDCINKFSADSEWISFLDLDEFIVPNKYDTVYDFLKPFQKKYPTVVVYWKVFGTSGLIDRDRKGSVVKDFVVSWPKYASIGKCFYNTAYKFDPSFKRNSSLVHSFYGNNGLVNLPPVDCFKNVMFGNLNPKGEKEFPIQINHYFTKSYNEYLEKASRGDAVFAKNPRNLDYFYEHEQKCCAVDYHAYRFFTKTQQKQYNRSEK